jgi:kynurenine formamidase
MRLTTGLLLLCCSLSACASQTPPAPAPPTFPAGRVVDLSHAYDASTIFWPTSDPFRLVVDANGMTPGGYYYAANSFSTSEHGGTHLDAPRHFAERGWTSDEIPLQRMMGTAVVVDASSAAAGNADYQITAADLQAWEAAHGRIPDAAVLLLRTGYSSRWPDAAAYLGTAERGDAAVAKLHFPGLHPDAARWLVAERNVASIGIDTASIDYGQSTGFESHLVLLGRNVPVFENLTALDALPPTGALVVALPMKIGGGSGGPLRAIGIVP